ncbi:MAG: hypothetical protein HY775_07675, partial [Acidobacteria bacterium]|nr:hypothetical protein [Acidobacteriota bacterium]
MTARRRLPLAALAVAVVAALVPAAPAAGQPAWVALAPPYDDAQADHGCLAPASSCFSEAEADAATGVFTLAAEATSLGEGTLPGGLGAQASTKFTALHHLDSPAAAVGYRVTVHIGSAEAAVRDNGYAEVDLRVSANHSAGCDGCSDGRRLVVVDLDRPTRVNEDVVVQLSIARPDGSAIPPGDFAIRVRLDAYADLDCVFVVCLNGRASVRAEGVATSVEGAITPPEGEQPPANDDLADATSVGSVPFVVDGRTHGATSE